MPAIRPTKPDTERVVFLGDIHVPYHDPVALELVCGFLRWFKPHRVYLIGDIADFYQISRFDTDPTRLSYLQSDVDGTVEVLGQIRSSCPRTTEIVFREGNHEYRLTRFLWSHPKIANLRSLRLLELLRLQELRIQHVHYNGNLRLGNFLIEHGDVVRQHAGATARAMLEKRGLSGISGHTHRQACYSFSDESGEKVWYENGCLCLRPEWMIGKPNWQQGFSVMHRWQNRFEVEQIRIINCRIYYHGLLWDASSLGTKKRMLA